MKLVLLAIWCMAVACASWAIFLIALACFCVAVPIRTWKNLFPAAAVFIFGGCGPFALAAGIGWSFALGIAYDPSQPPAVQHTAFLAFTGTIGALALMTIISRRKK